MKLLLSIICLVLTACSDAEVASTNLSKAADNFEITRRIIFYDSIQGTSLLSIEGLCSIEVDSIKSKLDVTCKTGANTYKKHFLGISNNVTYFAEQIESSPQSVYHYRVIFKPSILIPEIESK